LLKPSSHGFGGSEATQLGDRVDALSPMLEEMTSPFDPYPLNILRGGLARLPGEDAHEVTRAHAGVPSHLGDPVILSWILHDI